MRNPKEHVRQTTQVDAIMIRDYQTICSMLGQHDIGQVNKEIMYAAKNIIIIFLNSDLKLGTAGGEWGVWNPTMKETLENS